MNAKIGIIDYQMGNLRSVQKAFEKNGIQADIFSDANRLNEFDKIVLPGVGAFRDAVSELGNRNLIEPICDWIRADKPFLGICLGLQLLFEKSFEDGEHQGLGMIPGEVVRFELPATFKVPHMGWNEVNQTQEHPLWSGVPDNSRFYFVHSYFVQMDDDSKVTGRAHYGTDIVATLADGNIFAT